VGCQEKTAHVPTLTLCPSNSILELTLSLYREIEYRLHLNDISVSDSCRGVETENEGIEFAIRKNTQVDHWIPLRLSYFKMGGMNSMNTRIIRGYNVTAFGSTSVIEEKVSVCCDLLDATEIQLRWMGNAVLPITTVTRLSIDMWALSSMNVALIDNGTSELLFQDSFGETELK